MTTNGVDATLNALCAMSIDAVLGVIVAGG
jgi:hypothetical protein